MFTVAQRDALRERLLRLAEEDERVIAGAAVGSLAVDGGDRFSDLDLTFGIADHKPVAEVLAIGPARSAATSARYTLPISYAVRLPTACSCCRTRFSSTSR